MLVTWYKYNRVQMVVYIIYKTNFRLMQVLQYFRPSLSYHLSLYVCFVYFEWTFYTGFTVHAHVKCIDR